MKRLFSWNVGANNINNRVSISGRDIYDISKMKDRFDDLQQGGSLGPNYEESVSISGNGLIQTGQNLPAPGSASAPASMTMENAPVNKKPVNLTILHTNDVHGNLLPREDIINSDGDKNLVGGGAALGSVINMEREMAKARGEQVLLLDAGDMAMGTPISGLFEGKPVIEVMNREGYDAATIGNHDFDWGINALQNMIQDASFTFVAANIKDAQGQPLANVKPFIIKDLPGVKVGIVGLTTPDMKNVTGRDEVKAMNFEDPVQTLTATIPEMKKQGAEVIIVLSHMGLEQDRILAQNMKGIDLIVGGHSHNTLAEPIKVGDTLIAQTGFGGKNLGKVSLTWDPEKKSVVAGSGSLIPIDTNSINPDVEINSIVNKYQQKLDSVMDVKLGESTDDMLQPSDGKETNLGNLITDIMRDVAGTDVAFLNSGCIRTNLSKGEVKYKDIYSVIPFDSKIVTLSMKGQDIMDVIERSLEHTENDKVLQISGLNVVYNSTMMPGFKLLQVSTSDGNPIDRSKEYTVATIDFLAKGGDAYTPFTNGQESGKEGEVLHDAVANKVRDVGVLMAADTGRLKNVDDAGMERLSQIA
ncbi:MAG: bifunctional metallophosphatase/5'-nucleotidase [Firmicutes bacterium]|nr:bifunctional metallophosphatase/5'-nucleotidase [Bacillota bacterium]